MPLDVEIFIEEIKKRPALYNSKIKEYSDKTLKGKLWTEVYQQLIENWSELGDKEKIDKGNRLQKRWKNLRTCFKRECDAQKNVASVSVAKKRRQYIYFEQLLFLRDCFESRITSNSLEKIKSENEDYMEQDLEDSEEMHDDACSKPLVKSSYRRKAPSAIYEESLQQISRETKDEDKEIDEDKYFLLSLLATFKKFNDDQKYIARMEIMNVMRRVRMSGNLQSHSPNDWISLQHDADRKPGDDNHSTYARRSYEGGASSSSQSAMSPSQQYL